jgi:DNA-binding MarR family transcriptional regulator
MVRKSNHARGALVDAFGRAIADLQDATDLFDDAAAVALGLNRTDLRVLGLLLRGGPQLPSALADRAGLSRGAMTTAVDRLVREGYAARSDDPADGRRLRVEATPTAQRRCAEIWGPLAAQNSAVLEGWTPPELEKLLVLVERVRAVQLAEVPRVRAFSRGSSAPVRSKRRRP